MRRGLPAVLATVYLALPSHAAVTFDWAVVDNPGNAADTRYDENGVGTVGYTYCISKHEVTNTQYAEFLNAVADHDTNWLYNSMMELSTRGGITRGGVSGSYVYSVKAAARGQGPGGSDYTYEDKPVVYVSFLDAMRFVNWLENGQPTGMQGPETTEEGAYSISYGDSEVRNLGATFFVPNEDEWYKAAYYDPDGNGGEGVYYDYSTSTNATPDNNIPSSDSGNSANHYDGEYTTGNSAYPMTDVGAYTLSESSYGTYDQGGNVMECTETLRPGYKRVHRGGSWWPGPGLAASEWAELVPSFEYLFTGFRVASIAIPGLAADFDQDGDVDGDDFLLWQAGFQVDDRGDADFDGDTDGDDFLIWQAEFGSGDGSASGVVPEPTSMALVIAVAVAGMFSHRRELRRPSL